MKEENLIQKGKKAEEDIKKGDKTINQIRADFELPPLKVKSGEKKVISKDLCNKHRKNLNL